MPKSCFISGTTAGNGNDKIGNAGGFSIVDDIVLGAAYMSPRSDVMVNVNLIDIIGNIVETIVVFGGNADNECSIDDV